jgi:hypothetical protein
MAEQVSFWGAGDPALEQKYRDMQRQQRMAAMLQNVTQPDLSSWNSQRITPTYGWGQGLTQLLGSALQGYSEQKAEKTGRELEQERNKRLGDAVQRFGSAGDSNSKLQAAQDVVKYGGNPQMVAKMLDAQLKREEIRNVGANEQVFDPTANRGKGAPLYTNVAPDKPTDDQKEYAAAVAQGYKGTLFDFLQSKKNPPVNINLPANKYPNAFQEALGKSDAAKLDEYRKAADTGVGMVRTLDQLRKLNPTAMSGGGAQSRAVVSNWLAGWTGIQVTDPKVLSDTQQYNAIVSKSILDALGGSLGAGVSNADVAFIKDTVPKLEYSPEAREALINYMQTRAKQNIDLYQKAREYGEKNGGLKGFMPYDAELAPTNQPQVSKAPPPTNAKGWVLHEDAKGNKAYVSPDGKQYEVVQ